MSLILCLPQQVGRKERRKGRKEERGKEERREVEEEGGEGRREDNINADPRSRIESMHFDGIPFVAEMAPSLATLVRLRRNGGPDNGTDSPANVENTSECSAHTRASACSYAEDGRPTRVAFVPL
ncbi:hypothetical protein EVAR_89594_1 [Eumeta japonica]|uniref:Uncharacterized protein n=1 Tax=Eumeta variegata TaxID=151549 RepID=A0A4C1XM49_EUMVA|nr:hypothetical protein EVAR_89594_1 [Eumeta japonica]